MSLYSLTPSNSGAGDDYAEADPIKVEQFMRDVKSKQNLPLAAAGGFAAAIVAAIIWSIVTYVTKFQIGFMAIGVGFLVGYAVSRLGKGITAAFGITGAVFSLFGCLLGNLLTTLIVAARDEGVGIFEIINALFMSPSITVELMAATFSPIDVLFYAIAVYEGYKFSFRKTTDEETASLRKQSV